MDIFVQTPAVTSPSHFYFLDFIKTVAANLIVLHHLAFYGPMADHVEPVLPELIEWLKMHARIAVQAFLVIGGFLAARSLSPQGQAGIANPIRALFRRFMKLTPPFFVAMLLAVAASALAARWMTHDSISTAPTFGQLVAHALLLHGVLGVESLSAGAWYVAIDFQLYALLTLLLWLAGIIANGRPARLIVPALVIASAAASLFYFNRDPDWDNWALYFAGSYGLGTLAWWASAPDRSNFGFALLVAAMLMLGGLALEVDFRSRIAVALTMSLLLVAVYRYRLSLPLRRLPMLEGFGRISYAVFLVHFPVCLIINALFTRYAPPLPVSQGIGMLLAWAASIAAGAVFYRWIEIPLGRWTQFRRIPNGQILAGASPGKISVEK